jgi:uncharacterized damage-inducible protein DinB
MSRAQLTGDLRESRERVFSLIKGLTEEQFRFVPPGEDWNIATHLYHLLRCERLWAERAAHALRRDEPSIEGSGVTNDDDAGAAQRLAVPQVVHGMQASRRDLLAAIESGDEATLDRGITISPRGRMSLRQIATKMAAHEQEHAAAIEPMLAHLPPAPPPLIPLVRRP